MILDLVGTMQVLAAADIRSGVASDIGLEQMRALLRDAAAEIERLTGEVDNLRGEVGRLSSVGR